MNDIFVDIKQHIPFDIRLAVQGLERLSPANSSMLDEKESQDFKSMGNVQRKQEFLTSRMLLRELAKELSPQAADMQVLKDEWGKPYGKANGHHYYLSIAHSGDKVFCGMTLNQPIGIDLEPINREVPSALKKRMAHPEEQTGIRDLPGIQLWTLKEAYIKLCGYGLRLNMNEVKVEQENDDFAVIGPQKKACIHSFSAEGYWFSIAYYI